MAYVATAQNPLPIEYGHNGAGNSFFVPVVITMDTAASDLTVYTPAAGNFWAIVGIHYTNALAHSLVIKSGSTILTTKVYPASSTVQHAVGQGLYACGLAKGDAIKISATTNPILSVLIYVMEFNQLTIR